MQTCFYSVCFQTKNNVGLYLNKNKKILKKGLKKYGTCIIVSIVRNVDAF